METPSRHGVLRLVAMVGRADLATLIQLNETFRFAPAAT